MMALLHYFSLVRNEGLPDPEGALASVIPSKATEQANQEVPAHSRRTDKEEGATHTIDLHPRGEQLSEKYASKNGIAPNSKVLSRQLNQPINESSARLIKKACLVEQTRKRRAEEDPTVATLPPKKRGRPTLLGADLDKKVQLHKRRSGKEVVLSPLELSLLQQGVLF